MHHDDSNRIDLAEHRPRLLRVATRILTDRAAAEDAVQECWLRVQRTDPATIDNLPGWLTTTTARICLDMLRRRARVEPDDTVTDREHTPDADDPAAAAALADAVSEAMTVVLETLNPAERVAFVLHDTFGISFHDIGAVLERSPNAAKQLATRARTKIRGADTGDATLTTYTTDRRSSPAPGHADVVHAFLAAARGGDLATLVGLLHPDIVLRADHAAVAMGAPGVVTGAGDVAAVFSGRAQMAVAGSIDHTPAMIWSVGGRTRVAWEFTIDDGVVTRIDMIADPDTLDTATITTLEGD